MFKGNRPTCIREVFDEAWMAIFRNCVRAPLSQSELREILRSFTTHYQGLAALPRRTPRSLQRKWEPTLSAIALLMMLAQAPAWAATIEVTPGTLPSIKADGKCSLIEAIVNANRDARTHLDCVAGSGPDTIRLPEKSQQQLNVDQTLPRITSRIVIEGRGSTVLRNTMSFLTFFTVGPSGNLTLNEITLIGFPNYGVSNSGHLSLNDSVLENTGGLLNSGGVATLTNVRITGTRPYHNFPSFYNEGGGIQNIDGGLLVIRNSVLSDNEANNVGGGIFNGFGSTATLSQSVVSDNRTATENGEGGGISNFGSLLVVESTIADNEAVFGGGINNVAEGTVTVRRSTISGNDCYGGAGNGIFNSGKLQILSSTVSSNGRDDWGSHGGVVSTGPWWASPPYESNPELTILDSTVTGNRQGGGLLVAAGTLTLQRSIVSGNHGTVREIDVKPGVVISADEFNVLGHDGNAGVAGFVPGATDIVPNKPIGAILLPLADNGGGTKTHALAIGSPALDASPDDAHCPATDQRGNPRPRGPACDIGAFEGVAVLCNGKVTTMVGTINDDRLTGTAGPDVISGLLGNDTVYGLGGNDVVCAGSGADLVYGGPGADLLFGGPGDDRLLGQGGNDTLNGGVGQDRCDGGPGAGDTATTCETVNGVP